MNFIKKGLSLEKTVAPKILQYLYILSLIGGITYSILILIVAITNGFGMMGVLLGLIGMIFTPLVIRVIFELWIVLFKILEELQKLNKSKGKGKRK